MTHRPLLPMLALPFLALACSDSHVDTPVDGAVDTDAGDGRDCGGPVALCYANDASGCCLEPGTSASCSGGSWTCPPGQLLGSACARFDPVCEGIGLDGGTGPGVYDDCNVTSDCIVVPNSCCGRCGVPAVGDAAAVHMDRASDFYLDVACPSARDEPAVCPDCAARPDPHLTATCDMTGIRAACAVVNFATPEYASCTIDDDCRLTAPSCCACGSIDLYQTIAVRHDADLQSVLCDRLFPCPPCVPTFDERARARCGEAGLCVVDPAP